MAIVIPKIPKKFPLLAVEGCDNPLRESINKTDETKYAAVVKVDIFYLLFLFKHGEHSICYNKPPKYVNGSKSYSN